MATRKKAKGKAKRKKTPVSKATTRRKTRRSEKPRHQKKGSEEGAGPASITQESHADRERCGQAGASQPTGTARSSQTDAESASATRSTGSVSVSLTHYYSHPSVATLRLESGPLRVGDVIHICGHTTDLSQKVEVPRG